MSNTLGDDRRGYLYRHIRLDKNEVFYVGIGFDEKMKRAYSSHSRNRHWRNVVNITEYDVEILFIDLPKEQLVEKEKEFIALYGRKDLNEGTLVNMTDGGDGAVRYRFKHHKTWDTIRKDDEKYKILCQNRYQPFKISVKELDKDEYVIECDNKKDFSIKTGLSMTYANFLKDVDHKIITKINKSHKHHFPLGTILKYERLEKKKLVYPKKKKLQYVKPFNVLIYDKNDNLLDEIFCGKGDDFTKNTGLNFKALKNIRKYKYHKIKSVSNKTMHSYPVGSIVKINFLDRNTK
jgi:hypothetical protein